MANNKLETLSEIFNEKIFRIPDYQRGYSWEKEQLEDFWRDIKNLDETRIHYTGMITVEHKKENSFYHIIDGQQRLTTIMIFLKVILENFKAEDWIGDDYTGAEQEELVKKFLYKKGGKDGHTIKVVFGYEKDNPSDLFYRKNILSLNTSESFSISMDTLYTKNLQNAKQFFSKKLENLKKKELEVLIRKITKQLKFNFYEIDTNDGLDEFIIFETMNNRGKQLTTLELLKNRLIYLTTLLKNDKEEIEQLRNDINEVWKTVYEYLGKESQQKIDDDIFLKDHWIMYFGKYDRKKSNPEKEFLLKEHFTIQKVLFKDSDEYHKVLELIENYDNLDKAVLSDQMIDYIDIQKYIFNLQHAVVAYYNMINPLKTNYSNEIQVWLSKINRLGFDTFKPLLVSIFISKDISHGSDKLTDDHIVKVLKLIENYMFIKFKTMKGSKTTIYDFYNLAYEYHNKQSISRLIEKLDQKIFENHHNKLYKERSFLDIISGLYEDKKGWYDWNGLTYLLYEYELFLQNSFNGVSKLKWEEVNKESVEHIYPQNTVRSCWDTLNNVNKEYKFKLIHSIGNLVLLSKSNNSRLGNKCFQEKKEIFSIASYSTIEISKNSEWTIEKILERGDNILNFMSERWNIEISLEAKEHFLSL